MSVARAARGRLATEARWWGGTDEERENKMVDIERGVLPTSLPSCTTLHRPVGSDDVDDILAVWRGVHTSVFVLT